MFQLPDTTPCKCTNANPRREFHGDEPHRAIDLTFEVTGENTLLDRIAAGLREHHYCNRDLKAGQEALPGVLVPLPHLRFPQLSTEQKWTQPKARDYRWIWDWGREEEHVDFSDCALASLSYSLQDGGSVTVKFTVSYNGEELEDNELFGELCGMASMGPLHIQLLAPAELIPVKKGWRSGRADEPEKTDGGAPLLEGAKGPGDDDHDEDDTGDQSPEGTPEDALAATEPDFPTPPTPAPKRGRRSAAAPTTH